MPTSSMGDNFENQQAAAYTKLVKEYPLSAHVGEAKSQLKAMNRPVPEADPVAYARMKYEHGESHEARRDEQVVGTLRRRIPI